MAARGVPGGQLAVGHARERAVWFTLPLGLADAEQRTRVATHTRFRIASLSKTFTAAALFTLFEEGRLSPATPMLEALPPELRPATAGRPGTDERLHHITLHHLLTHTAGWDRMVSGDAMFQGRRLMREAGLATPPTVAQHIRAQLARPLDFEPGSRFSYSNSAYAILGRVLEHATGLPYEECVRTRVLAPAGITGPHLGSTLHPGPEESRYHMIPGDPADGPGPPLFPGLPDPVPRPYGTWSLEVMDAHGGWVARAQDGVRFLLSLDDFSGRGPFRQPATWAALLTPPPGMPGHDAHGQPLPVCQGPGFRLRHGPGGTGISHSGSLSGTNAHLSRRADGLAWCLLLNQRHHLGDREQTLVQVVEAVFDECVGSC